MGTISFRVSNKELAMRDILKGHKLIRHDYSLTPAMARKLEAEGLVKVEWYDRTHAGKADLTTAGLEWLGQNNVSSAIDEIVRAEADEGNTTTPEDNSVVPADLAAQGWRIKTTNKRQKDWPYLSTRHRWERMELSNGMRLVRPVLQVRLDNGNTSVTYAHEGWGEGLHPSAETVKIWRWWWFKGQPVQVYAVSPSGASYKGHYGWVDFHGSIDDWGGPVLPRWTIEGMK